MITDHRKQFITGLALLCLVAILSTSPAHAQQPRNAAIEKAACRAADEFCRRQGLQPLIEAASMQYRQGWDGVYLGRNGDLITLEVKANGSQLQAPAYAGAKQNTVEYAIQASKRVLTSPTAPEAEKQAARKVLEAAAGGKLEHWTIRAKVVDGQPVTAGRVSRDLSTRQTAGHAKQILRELGLWRGGGKVPAKASARPARAGAPQVKGGASAGRAAVGRTTGKALMRGAAGVGLALEGYARYKRAKQIEQDHRAGKIDAGQRKDEHVANVTRAAGGLGGALAGAKGGALLGAKLGTLAGPVGTAIGGTAGAVLGGTAGYLGGGELASRAGRAASRGIRSAWGRLWK